MRSGSKYALHGQQISTNAYKKYYISYVDLTATHELKTTQEPFHITLIYPFILQLPSYKISVKEGETIRAKTRIEIGSHRTTDIPR